MGGCGGTPQQLQQPQRQPENYAKPMVQTNPNIRNPPVQQQYAAVNGNTAPAPRVSPNQDADIPLRIGDSTRPIKRHLKQI